MTRDSTAGRGPGPSADGESAEDLFDAWLSRAEAGKAQDFEKFCTAHADHADALRQLHEQWQEFEALAGEIRGRYAAGPEMVASEVAADPLLTSAARRIERLRERGPERAPLELRGEIGRGGMGIVQRVYDPELQREMARKVLRQTGGPLASSSARTLARFLAEAQITGQLDHPGIVPVHELGLTETGELCFTMALIKGRSLSEIFRLVQWKRENWTRTRAVGVLLKMCETLAYAHSKNVLHRDLKPSNVMVGRFGEVYVMDWGLAKTASLEEPQDSQASGVIHTDRKVEEGAGSDWTLEGSVLGTPCYMAPEQAAGRLQELGPRSDVYSLGAILYELCAGHAPYAGPNDDRDSGAILERLRRGAPPALHEQGAEVPPELQAICEKAMARHPEDRYSSVQEMAEDLRAYLEHRVVSAYEAGAWAELRKWMRRNRTMAAVIALATVVALASLSTLLVLQNRAKDDALFRANELAAAKQSAEEEAAALAAVVGWMEDMFELPLPQRARGRVVTAKELVDRAAATMNAIEATPAVLGRLGASLGELYQHLGLGQQALEALERARNACESELGPRHPVTVRARALHAQVLSEQGRFDEALEEYSALDDCLRDADLPFGERLKILNDRAALDLYRHEDAAAEQGFRRALEIATGEMDPRARELLVIRNNLGVLLQRQQRLDEAAAEFEEIVRLRLERGEERHPDTLTARMNLAVVVGDRGQLEEAIVRMAELSVLRAEVLGASHPDTLQCHVVRSSYLRRVGRADEALPELQTTCRLAEEHLLPTDPIRLDARRELGVVLVATGRADSGIALLEQDVSDRRALMGPSILLQRSLRELARAHELNENTVAEIETLGEALRLLRARGVKDRLALVDVLYALGRAHVRKDEPGKAELYLAEAQELCETPPPISWTWPVSIARWQADAKLLQGEDGEAEELYLQSADLARTHLDAHDSVRRDTLRRYAQVLAEWEFYDSAVDLMDEVLQCWPDPAAPAASRDRELRERWWRLR